MGLQQVLGLGSYETAWTWLHKLRRAMVRPGRDQLTGRVEVDEAYIGGLEDVAAREETRKSGPRSALGPGGQRVSTPMSDALCG